MSIKQIKVRSIEISTNGCLIFSYANLSKLNQIKINEKDYNSLTIAQKQKKELPNNFLDTIYKHKFLNNEHLSK